MGGGAWTNATLKNYSASRGVTVDFMNSVNSRNLRQFYSADKLHKSLDPKKIMRECCDSEEHPNTVPVILALDVTGSMGSACATVASKLNDVMTSLYKKYKDVEFCVMGIGDLAYDEAPIQMSQFESDVRILESLDKIYMEHGGGGNGYESYTAAWYMGLHHTKLDCWKRGKKGVIITMGDEALNPYLPTDALCQVLGQKEIGNVETAKLYKEASEVFDIYHIAVTGESSYSYHESSIKETFEPLLGEKFMIADARQIDKKIVSIIDNALTNNNPVKFAETIENTPSTVNEAGQITW